MSAKLVTLVVVYEQPNSGRSGQAAVAPVRIRMSADLADQVIAYRQKRFTTVAEYPGRDANGNPFCIDVGLRAAAVYCEA